MTTGGTQFARNIGSRRFRSPATILVALLLVTGAAGCGTSGDDEESLTVGAASSLTAALTEYSDKLPASLPPARTTFAGSDQIAAQISQGAGIDVFAAASTVQPRALFQVGLVGKPVEFAGNRVVIGVPRGSSIGSLGDLAKPGVSLVIGDDSVPIGTYARRVLARLPAGTERDMLANVKSEDPDAATMMAKLVQGAADAGLVYATDVSDASNEIRAIEIPARLQPRIAYSAAVVADSDQPEASREYIRGLLEGAGAVTLRDAGFPVPPP